MASEETTQLQTIIGYLLNFLWLPFIGWYSAKSKSKEEELKRRDSELSALRERTSVIEATCVKREDVLEIVDGKFERLEDKIDGLTEHVNEMLRSLPRRSGDG